ncbi:site-specific integrase [Halocynthiibacter styelae]|uniref:Site-specific integrase n=1 Tax=Halocynthiibacter styelae TaxID=2761955 RepID=A0A8J7IDA7_9RHOB|nr:site-specific integrase [Paenihalocynthiibacter styelae]MBI1492447.1 site-specific integrase [Paenihalocynthiibacter styelae]
MNAQPHLFKRGDIYQWRRKTRRFSTKNVDIKLSLGTTDRNQAHILARKVSAESDLIMEQIVRNRIPPEHGRAFLTAVIRKERAKIEQLRMLARIDSLDPADDARHDNAMAEAWDRIATSGVKHVPAADIDDLVHDNIELIRKDLVSAPRQKAIKGAFKDQTGDDNLSAMEYAQVLDIYVSGKAKAWAGAEERTPAVQSIQQETTAPCLELPSSKIIDVVNRMNVIKRAEGIEEKTLRQYQSFAALFTMLSGIGDITKVRQPDVKAFRADLSMMPKSWGKSPKDQTATRDEVMAKAATLPADKIGLSVGTINRHLEHLNQIADWARDEGLPVDQNLKPAKLRKKETVRARDKRASFSVDQLKAVFRNPVWTGSKSEYHQTKPGQDIFKNGIYWCPLIGAYTGARREEIAGLAPSDIIEVEGIWCFSIEDSELRRIKNLSSRRMIPIHSHLIELGFPDHVRKTENNNQNSLFPNLYEAGNNAFGRKVGRRMRQIIDMELGVYGAKLSFHSLRHYVQNHLDHEGVDDKLVRDIIGHEGKDIHDKVYRKSAQITQLHEAIERLPKLLRNR